MKKSKKQNMQEELPDPRFFVSTKRQRQVAAEMALTEPQRVTDKVFLGSRASVVLHRQRLRELGIAHIVMCCDRAPDAPDEFEYCVVAVNNETRDSSDQHSRHVHDNDGDGHEHCGHGPSGPCGDLHLTKWFDDESGESTCLAQQLAAWIDSRPGPVLVHGYDGASNSAAVVVAYLMQSHCVRLTEAVETVTKARPVVYLPEFLMRDLRVLDTRLALARSSSAKQRIVPKRN